MAGRFSLDRVATPACVASVQLPVRGDEGPARKMPKLGELVIQQGPKPPLFVKRADKADVEVLIYRYTDDASTVWEDVKTEPNLTMWQIQILHDAKHSLTQGPLFIPSRAHMCISVSSS